MQRRHLGGARHVVDRRQRLVLDGDRPHRLAGVLERLRGDDRDGLAVVAHAIDREHRLVGELEAVGLGAGHVGVRQHGVHAGQRERRRDVDRDDARVRVRAAQRRAVQHPGDVEVARVRELAGDLGHAVGALDGLADAAAHELRRAHARSSAAACARPRRCGRSRCSGRGCPRAPRGCRRRSARRSRASSAAVATTRPGVQKPHCTAPAATNARCTACSAAVRREALDRDDLAPVGLRAVHEAGAHELAVEQHRAGPALALLAGALGAGQVEPLAQHEEQALGAVARRPRRGSPLTRSSILIRGTSRARGA